MVRMALGLQRMAALVQGWMLGHYWRKCTCVPYGVIARFATPRRRCGTGLTVELVRIRRATMCVKAPCPLLLICHECGGLLIVYFTQHYINNQFFQFTGILHTASTHQPLMRGRSEMPIINSQVKPFKATAYHNGDFVTVTDETFKGKWSLVVFYPADFTFVCPTELGDLADRYAEFQKLGVEIYSVSTDTHFTPKAWHDTSDTNRKIQYPMIGDPPLTLSRNFDVLIEEEGMALRGTFVIHPDGRLKLCEIHD